MISPTYDELHDRVTEDALLLELMELLRECREMLEEPFRHDFTECLVFRYQDAADLVKRIEEVMK